MRFTIERMRTLVLGAGALLVVALVAFLAIGRWKSHFNFREIPKRLGVDIQQEANGVTYTQAHGGHTLFKIHASKVVQLKAGNRALLHDVQIELYGEDGNRVDKIAGDEFEYDQKNGTATAAGPVEITLMRPGEAPAVAPKATPGQAVGEKAKGSTLANAAHTASEGQIHVKTSGLTFDQKSGVATTAERVEFAVEQGTGSSIGATFDSDNGHLVLDHAVELNVLRGVETVLFHAQHAEFERGDLLCHMRGATAHYREGEATAGVANVQFRADGSAERLDASDGFSMKTATGARVAAPNGTLEFGDHNQPKHGRLEGGATMDSDSNGRQVHGAAPTADLEFTTQGELHHAHLERGVIMHSEETSEARNAPGETQHVSRDWHSPVADLDFRSVAKGQVELAAVRGTGGVLISGETQTGKGPVVPSRMTADQVTGTFGAGQSLSSVVGTGHASMEQATAAGARQTTTGDRIEANFATASSAQPSASPAAHAGSEAKTASGYAAQIQSAKVDGNVVLVQEPAAKPGTTPKGPLRATAGKAVYEGSGEWLHLTINPRVEDGGLQLSANAVDVSEGSGDAFAHGNVKATWIESPAAKAGAQATPSGGRPVQGSVGMGGQGPAHVIASEAQLDKATGEATFRGQARLWQQSNSVNAPVIVLDRARQTLVARTTSQAEPVTVVLLSSGSPLGRSGTGSATISVPVSVSGPAANKAGPSKSFDGKSGSPSVIRLRGGDMRYSDAERKAVMHGGAGGSVVAETGTATSTSNEVELVLLPPGNHAGRDGGAAQVDRMTATGHVIVSSQGRRGTGERLMYSSETGQYVLTGTAAAPPRMTDSARGMVSGESLIFNTFDDSVSIEGHQTTTETRAPK